MATIIGLKELRENTEAVAERVSKGETFVVVKRSKPIFRLLPLGDSAPINDDLRAWTTAAINRYRPALEALSDK
jgi:prevent-host-death family protein